MHSIDPTFIASVQPVFRRVRRFRILLATSFIALLVFSQTPFAFAALIAIMLLVVKWANAEQALSNVVWEKFAAFLTPTGPAVTNIDELSGVIGGIGHQRSVSTLVQGKYENSSIRVLQLSVTYNPTSKNGRYSRSFRVLEITTQQYYNHVFIDSKLNQNRVFPTAMNILSRSVAHNDTLKVEGDVNKYFTIYIPAGSTSENLITLTPDKLLALRDFGTRFDIEFIDNRIYLISPAKITSMRDILAYQQEAMQLIKSIGSDIARSRNLPTKPLHVRTPSVITF